MFLLKSPPAVKLTLVCKTYRLDRGGFTACFAPGAGCAKSAKTTPNVNCRGTPHAKVCMYIARSADRCADELPGTYESKVSSCILYLAMR